MEETLQDVDHRKQQTKKPPSAYSKQSHKIIYEASRRIKKDSIPLQEKKKREISEIATLAKNGLMKKANSHDPVNLFRNFDECRNGYVTYEDFNQALLATNAGLSKNEISLLAQTLDQDHNGILDYTELTSSLTNLSKKYSLSIPTESSPKDVSSLQQTNTPPSPPPAVAVAPPVDPVDEGYQRAYEYGLRHLKETQEIQELFRRNEKKYYESLGPEIEIPYSERIFHLSSLQPPRLDQSNKSYGKGSGNIPITMVDHLDGVILPRSNKSEYFGKSSGNGDESDGSSYSDLYLKSQKEPINVAKSYNGRHITGAGPLSTSAVVDQKGAASGGPVRSYERAYIGNPTNPTNRSSRDFSNAFIVDQVSFFSFCNHFDSSSDRPNLIVVRSDLPQHHRPPVRMVTTVVSEIISSSLQILILLPLRERTSRHFLLSKRTKIMMIIQPITTAAITLSTTKRRAPGSSQLCKL